MSDVKKQLNDLLDEAEEVNEVKSDLFLAKNDLTIKAVGVLLQSLQEGIDELVQSQTDKKYYDENLGKTLSDNINKLASAFSKIKEPTVNVSPNISVDMSAISSIASDISKTNNGIISMLNKIAGGDKSDELHRLIISMIGKQNMFLDNAIKQIDYTEKFDQIIEVIKQQQKPVPLGFEIQRNPMLKEMTGAKIIYK